VNEATIGSTLTKKREELGITRVQAAGEVGMSRTTYSSYERDTQRPSIGVFPALAAFLNVTIEELLTLYGATAIAVLRPTLEKVLAEPDEFSSHLVESNEELMVVDEPYWLGPAAAIPGPRAVQDVPDVPGVPEVPDESDLPDVPGVPEVPDESDLPDVPEVPEVPKVPDAPDVPEIPDAPDAPDVPEVPFVKSGQAHEYELKPKKKRKGKKKKRKN
jgi:transcriptional regulator with XRE-family HTH domain